MSITFLPRDDDSIDFPALLNSGVCHYVSVAMPGLTVASSLIERAGGFDVAQRNDFMMTVNRARETGTLYPQVNITLLPSPRASYGGLDSSVYNARDYPEAEVIAHILDAFKANAQYIKSGRMYFDFRNLCVSEVHYVACLRAAIERLPAHDVPEVITWQPSSA